MAKEKKTQVQAGPTMDQVNYVPSLKKKYKEEIVGKLMKEFSYSTVMQVPRLVKITINQGIGAATQDRKLVDVAQQELSLIAGALSHCRSKSCPDRFKKGHLQLQTP